MSQRNLTQVSRDDILHLCSRTLYTIDGLWFLEVEKKYGFDVALEMDIEVWRQLCLIEGKRVKKFFDINEASPVRAVISIIQNDPLWTVFHPQIVELGDNKAVFRFADCPPQEARLKDGKSPLPCRQLGQVMYQSYCDVVDPRIKVSCVTSPPDPHPPEYWCEWRLDL